MAAPLPTIHSVPTRFRKSDGSAVKHPIYSVHSYKDCFPDVQDVHYPAARRHGVRPVRNREEAERHKQELVYVGANPYYKMDEAMSRSIPYLVPRASLLLHDIGRRFLDSLAIKGVPLHTIIVTSVLRTEEDVANVAFKFGPVSLKLHERDVNDAAMTTTEEGDGHYVNRCSDAVADYDGASNTQSLLSRGLDVSLPDDSFIPSLGQLYVMYAIKNKLNEALEYVGHDPLADAWYWSSTEISATYAWSLAFFSGYFDYYYKTYELRVRPVSAFIPSSL